jgi:hypothetical protein
VLEGPILSCKANKPISAFDAPVLLACHAARTIVGIKGIRVFIPFLLRASSWKLDEMVGMTSFRFK